MVKLISIHSSRGGTGKSLISSNIGTILAQEGWNVAILDFDFRAPSLLTIFHAKGIPKKWMNDVLEGKARVEDVMVDLTVKWKTKGKLLLGFANPNMEAMREIAQKDRKWQMQALKRIVSMKITLQEKFNIDIIIIDTSPGVQYSSVNAVVSSDISLIISSLDILDIEGVKRMISDLYEPFEKETYILVNKARPHMFVSEKSKQQMLKDTKKLFNKPLIAIIPCYCDILLAQRISIFSQDNPEHPFSGALKEVALRLEKLT